MFHRPTAILMSTFSIGTLYTEWYIKNILSTPIASIKNGITSNVIKLAFILKRPKNEKPIKTAAIKYNIPTSDSVKLDYTKW